MRIIRYVKCDSMASCEDCCTALSIRKCLAHAFPCLSFVVKGTSLLLFRRSGDRAPSGISNLPSSVRDPTPHYSQFGADCDRPALSSLHLLTSLEDVTADFKVKSSQSKIAIFP